MPLDTKPDYRGMKVGDRLPMPVLNTWEGENQSLYYEIQAHCRTLDPAPQFQIETVRTMGKPIEYWLERIR
jgi:hypothetical protein